MGIRSGGGGGGGGGSVCVSCIFYFMTRSVVDHRTVKQFLLFIQRDKKTGIMFMASVTHLKTTSQNNCHIKGAVTCAVCTTLRQGVFH